MEATQVFIGWSVDKQNMVYADNEILLSPKKEVNSDICYNMDEPWGHYAKWNKPVWFHLHGVLRVVKIRETESRMVVARDWREGRTGRYCLVDVAFQFCKMKRVLQMEGDDGCPIMWMCLMPLNWTLKNG